MAGKFLLFLHNFFTAELLKVTLIGCGLLFLGAPFKRRTFRAVMVLSLVTVRHILFTITISVVRSLVSGNLIINMLFSRTSRSLNSSKIFSNNFGDDLTVDVMILSSWQIYWSVYEINALDQVAIHYNYC